MYFNLKIKAGKNICSDMDQTVIGSFRLDYEYESEYEYDFSILVFRLHIIMSHTHFIPWATLST